MLELKLLLFSFSYTFLYNAYNNNNEVKFQYFNSIKLINEM